MEQLVFISHTAQDAKAAFEICNALERAGVRCWFAQRDVPAGSKRSEAIIEAIGQARVFLVLISEYTAHSIELKNEVERAVSKRSILIPVRLEDTQPAGALEYFLSTSHWFDVFPNPLGSYLPALTNEILITLGRAAPAVQPHKKKPRDKRMVRLFVLGSLFLLLIGAAASYFFSHLTPPLEFRTFHDESIALNEKGIVLNTQKVTRQGFVERLADDLSMEFVEIPEGTFTMGLNGSDSGVLLQQYLKAGLKPEVAKAAIAAEMPAGRVRVVRFYFQRDEVTQEQWAFVSKLSRVKMELPERPSRFSGAGLPVESISWEEALEFCARLSRRTSRPYRLPSEAEWEYACRAGSQAPFHSGATLTNQIANFNTQIPWGSVKPSPMRGEPLGLLPGGSSNAFGLMGMHGNVAEWCMDHWHDNYQGSPSGAVAWKVGGDPEFRVARGGSFEQGAAFCRCGFRWKVEGVSKNQGLGFRVALYAGEIGR